jgi:hypothetical protein
MEAILGCAKSAVKNKDRPEIHSASAKETAAGEKIIEVATASAAHRLRDPEAQALRCRKD